jgi:hypothetical protein
MAFILATTITCNQLYSLLFRLEKNLDLTPTQKLEVIKELTTFKKFCPLPIKTNA